MRRTTPFAALLWFAACLSPGCVLTGRPAPAALHEPAPSAAPHTLTCAEAERLALRYAASHRMGAVKVKSCHREGEGRRLEVSLKRLGRGEGGAAAEEEHVKIRFDGRDGRVLAVKEGPQKGERENVKGKGREKPEGDEEEEDEGVDYE